MLDKRLMVAKGGRSLPWERERCQGKLVVARGDGYQGMKMVANKLLVANEGIWLQRC